MKSSSHRSSAFVMTVLSMVVLLCPGSFNPSYAAENDDLERRNIETRREYERLKQQITISTERMKALEAELVSIREDNAALTAALIQAAKTEKKISEDIEDIESRLVSLRSRQDEIRSSLGARRALLGEVLGALQRMGLNPPPALLVNPEDALASVRSAILLGAVVPELREETEILIADLKALKRIVASISAERDRLALRIGEQVAEKQRLDRLLAERRRVQTASEAAMAEEQAKTEKLAEAAGGLEDLITSLASEIEKIRAAREKALKAEEEKRRRAAELANRPVPKENRLVQSRPFGDLKGHIPIPVVGRITTRFGTEDALGGHRNGDTVLTQSGAIVTAPADATVLYSGPFRSYGQLLILDAGNGYHVVMAGLERINVGLGQSLLAGEPVGAMGEVKLASITAQGAENGNPELYIEFRKDGKPVDPAPWWANTDSGRTGNDS